jgi:uncharacterized protein (TIGR04168 family)
MSEREPVDVGGEVAVVGDLHSAWESEDVSYFHRAAYPAVFVTGDLGRSRSQDGRHVARSLTQLGASQVLVMPGNNDVEEYPHIRAELTYRRARADLLTDAVAEGASLPPSGEPACLCSYSLHPLELGGLALTVVAGRPFSMGGPQLSFPEALARLFQIRSMADSSARLCQLVDQAPTEHIVFFAHNGPTGLGALPEDLWGRDFHPDAGDWGDPDLRAAIDHAVTRGRKVLAVIAGHMHWALRGQVSTHRRWQLQRDGILYLNAARVPRVFGQRDGVLRQHIRLQLSASGAQAEERLISDG